MTELVNDIMSCKRLCLKPDINSANKMVIGYETVISGELLESIAEELVSIVLKKYSKHLGNELSYWDSLSQTQREVMILIAYDVGIEEFLGYDNVHIAMMHAPSDVCYQLRRTKWYEMSLGFRAEELIQKFKNQ